MPNRGMIPETGTVVLRPLGEGENTAPVFVRVGRASAPSPSLARPGGQRGEGMREHIHNSDEPLRMHTCASAWRFFEVAHGGPTRAAHKVPRGKASGNRLCGGGARCMLKGMLLDFFVSSLRKGSSLIALYVEYESQQSIPL